MAPASKAAHPVDIASLGPTMIAIVAIAIVILIVLSALVYTGRITQKGPHGRRGSLGPPR